MVIPLLFPKVPQSSLGILRVPQLPPPLEHPLLRTLQNKCLSNHQINQSKRKFHPSSDNHQIPRSGRVDLLVFDGGQGVGGFLFCVFFLGGGMERKNAGARNPEAARRKGGVFGICCCYLGFCFLVTFFLLCTMMNQHQTTSWEKMFGTCSKHLRYLKVIQELCLRKKKKDKTNVTSVSLGGMVQVFVLRDNIPLTILTKDRINL